MRPHLKGFSLLHLFRRNYLRTESCCKVQGKDEKGSLTSATADDALAAGPPWHFDFRAYPHDNLLSSVRVYERDLNAGVSCTVCSFGRHHPRGSCDDEK